MPRARHPLPSPERLRELLHYDPETGTFVWRTGQRAGQSATKMQAMTLKPGHCMTMVHLDGRRFTAARIAWRMTHGTEPRFILRANNDQTDDRLANLKESPVAVRQRGGYRRRASRGWEEWQIGDSAVFSADIAHRIRPAAAAWGRRHGAKFITRATPEGLRVERVA